MIKMIEKFIKQNFRCKHNWHFCLSHLSNIGIPTAFGDYIISAECTFCGKKVTKKNKLRKLLEKEGI